MKTMTTAGVAGNSIFLISPYQHHGMWVFDDPAVGLVQEPFVSGADTLIDLATSHIPGAGKGFNLLFSAGYFPSAQIRLELSESDKTGSIYFCDRLGLEAWLCPALYKYFDVAPASIYAEFRPMSGRIKNKPTYESKIKTKAEQYQGKKPRLSSDNQQPRGCLD